MAENKDIQFFLENLKMNSKKITYWSRDSNPSFSVIFSPMIWIFIEGEGDEIKSKQASKRDGTLKKFSRSRSAKGQNFLMSQLTINFVIKTKLFQVGQHFI